MEQQEQQKNAGEIAFEGIQEMLSRSRGWGLIKEEFNFLYKSKWNLDSFYGSEFLNLYGYSWRGIIVCATEGYEFVPERRLSERFYLKPGCRYNVRDAYSFCKPFDDKIVLPSTTFMNFAKTFWTFHVVRMDLRKTNLSDYAIYKFLFKLETDLANVFFPRPEIPMRKYLHLNVNHIPLPVIALQGAQREVIIESGASIDVDEFFTNNPIFEGHIDYWSQYAYEDDQGFLKKTGKKLKDILF
ncbi:MAG: hypothetical protein HYW01_00760 [Deltaproteobacteria bacterium]|nr:hypothetical protein [Deltaproteobacteria bacterium]